jgi:hypothetical protein
MYCRDVKQLADSWKISSFPKQTDGEHHALADAEWCASTWAYVMTWVR